jgi:type IX secretion system PorP/SprF family membrane protein
LSIVNCIAQQDPQFSQHQFTKLYYNPGNAGAADAICATLLYRNQYTGFTGGGEPKTAMVTAEMPMDVLHGAIGISAHALDQLGAGNGLGVRAMYAYRTDLGPGRIGIGAGIGYLQQSLNGKKLIYNDAGDQSIPTNNASGGTYDLSLGIYFNTEKLHVGISTNHITENDLKITDSQTNINIKLARHYFFMAGYNIELSPSLSLRPAVLVKSDATEHQVDGNANLMIDNKFWVGAGYRLEDAIVLMAGMEIIPNLRLGYSYDLTTSEIKTVSSGTHEIALNYCLNVVRDVKRQFHRNVRFL